FTCLLVLASMHVTLPASSDYEQSLHCGARWGRRANSPANRGFCLGNGAVPRYPALGQSCSIAWHKTHWRLALDQTQACHGTWHSCPPVGTPAPKDRRIRPGEC